MTVDEAEFEKSVEEKLKANLKPGDKYEGPEGEELIYTEILHTCTSKCQKCLNTVRNHDFCIKDIDDDDVRYKCTIYNRAICGANSVKNYGQQMEFLTDTRKCKRFKRENGIFNIPIWIICLIFGIIFAFGLSLMLYKALPDCAQESYCPESSCTYTGEE